MVVVITFLIKKKSCVFSYRGMYAIVPYKKFYSLHMLSNNTIMGHKGDIKISKGLNNKIIKKVILFYKKSSKINGFVIHNSYIWNVVLVKCLYLSNAESQSHSQNTIH